MALPGEYIEELTERITLDGTEVIPASVPGATEDYKFTLTRFKNWFLSLIGLSFKENVTFEKQIVSTVTSPTAPMVVASAVEVANMKVESSSTVKTTVSLLDANVHPGKSGFTFSSISSGSNYPTGFGSVIKMHRSATPNIGDWEIFKSTAVASAYFIRNCIGISPNTFSDWFSIQHSGNSNLLTVNWAALIMNATNYQKNGFFVTKNLAASANITSAAAVNIQMNASTDYEYVISPGITATLNLNDASFQYNSITMIYATGGTALKLTSPGVTFYQNGVALVADTVVGYDGTKLNEIGIKVLSSTRFLVVRG